MEIKHEKGIVTFEMRAGKDMVRNTMPIGMAKSIVARAKETKEIEGGVWIDNKYLFPTVPEKKKSTKKEASENAKTTSEANEKSEE